MIVGPCTVHIYRTLSTRISLFIFPPLSFLHRRSPFSFGPFCIWFAVVAMAFLSSLMQALRQSTERAVAHVRPPGPIKHGGGAPWKQRLGHAHSVYPYSTSASATVNISEYAATIKVSDRPLVNLFRSIVEHAITPVFRGIKTEQLINEEVKSTIRKATNNFSKPTNNYRKPDPSKGIYDYRRPSPLNSLLQHQRLRKTTADVGLRFAPNDGFK